MTAGPLVAKRMRRTFGIARSASPISSMCCARSWYASPPLMTMSSSSGRDAMYWYARRQRSSLGRRWTFSTSSVSSPIAYDRVQNRQ